MAISISNYRITPYTQKDLLPKVIFGGTWGIEAEITGHEAGDTYILAVDYERLVYPLDHAVCALTNTFAISNNILSMSVNLESSRLAKWISSIKKPTPIYVQIVRVRESASEVVYSTLLLDEILALPSIIDGDAYQDENTPIGDLLATKLDKPEEAGTEGQVLTLDNALQPVWADAGAMAQEQADWTEADTDSPAYIKHKPTIPTVNNGTLTITQNGTSKGSFGANQGTNASINLVGENNVIEAISFNGATAAISNKTAVISASIPTVNNAKITITQGGVSKGAFTLNQSNNQTIALDAGGSGGETPSDAKITITQGGTSKGSFTLNQSNSATIAIDAQQQADWLATSGVTAILNKPTVGSGVLTISQNGTSKGSFGANQTGNTSINLAGENNVIEAVTFNGTSATISNKVAAISATIPTVNNAKITITQGGTSKGSFTLNQSNAATIALDAGGGGGSWDGTFTEVITSAATLTAEPAHSYYWEVGAQDATLSASITSDFDYDIPIDIAISGGTVTVSGITRNGLFADSCVNRCILTKRYDRALIYVYCYEAIS